MTMTTDTDIDWEDEGRQDDSSDVGFDEQEVG